jgi:pyridoxal phosphate enzyme (YggS family)
MWSSAEIGAAFGRVREEVGPDVTIVCATKYVPAEHLDRLAEAGISVVGENRAQDLAAKHERFGDRFRWHFIGHLQSRKAPVVSELCELCHSLDSLTAARKLQIPALVEVNLAGEASKSGVPAAELGTFISAVSDLGVDVRGLMTMPPLTSDPERSRPYFRELALLAGEHGLAELSMGTTQDYRVAVEEGATLVRVGSVLFGG